MNAYEGGLQPLEDLDAGHDVPRVRDDVDGWAR